MPTAPAGAGGRLSAASAEAKKRAADRLQPRLEKANSATYLRAMQAHAKAFGAPKPKAITDKDVLAQISARARVSADSIVNTQSERMSALVAQQGGLAAAQAPFKEWEAAQSARIAAFESGMTANAAQRDFVANNELTGMEHIEPDDTAGCNDVCDEAVGMGSVPIGDLSDDWPAHVNCPHGIVREYDTPDDPNALWFGEAAAE